MAQNRRGNFHRSTTESSAEACTVVVRKLRYKSVDLNLDWRGGEAVIGSEGWNVAGGVDGKINTMSDCRQVYKTDGGYYTEPLSA